MIVRMQGLLSAIFLSSTLLLAEIPRQSWQSSLLGIDYHFLTRDYVLENDDNTKHSREVIHLLHFHYAPIEYLRFALGIGLDRLKISSLNGSIFRGNYGFSPALRLAAFSPMMARESIRITGSATMLYINCKNHLNTRYQGLAGNAGGGLLFHIGPYVNLESGAKASIIFGKDNKEENFSNSNKVRGYINTTLISSKGSFLTFHFDLSPEISGKWDKMPGETSLGLTLGILWQTAKLKKKREIKNQYFPNSQELQEKLNETGSEIKKKKKDKPKR